MANATRNTDSAIGDLGIRPLNARSVVLSVLLGSHPPRLPVSALLRVADLFAIAPGTVRTALSRMFAAGEVTTTDGRYQLTGRMLRRQQEQDQGRSAPPADWDGRWWAAVVLADRRSVAERRRFRSSMVGRRMGELRPDVWLRPANLDGPVDEADLLVTLGHLEAGDPRRLAAELWDLDAIDSRARRLVAALRQVDQDLQGADEAALAPAFQVAAACVQFLRAEPQLPAALASMPASLRLRRDYDDFDQRFTATLRTVLAPAVSA